VTDSNGLRVILAYIKPYQGRLLIVLALMLASSLVALVPPLLAGKLTTTIVDADALSAPVAAVLGLWLLVLVVGSAISFYSSMLCSRTGSAITAGLRQRLYEHMQALPISYHQQQRRGTTLTILYSDSRRISDFATGSLLQLLPSLLTFIAALAVMAWMNWLLALLALVFLPTYVLALKIFGRKLRPLSRQWVEADSAMYSVMEENLGMLPAIKAFTREATEAQRLRSAIDRLLDVSHKQILATSLITPVTSLLTGAAIIATLGVGYLQIQAGALEPGQLVSILFYANLLMSPLRSLSNLYGQWQTTRGASERLVQFLQTQPEPTDSGLQVLPRVEGLIEYRDVRYRYPGRPEVLQGINLSIAPGETVAITGANGVGKSTLAHLLMRFADPDAGTISIDKVNIREATIGSVREQIGLVAQHTLLLNGSVAQNIGYGLADASLEAIEAAARSARAHDYICQLPQGYDTVIGDQGVRLSGGQRQRLALARTLLKDPAILILDEATAMFDPRGEQEFIRECHQVFLRKTVILITHRPASLALADRVLELRDGHLLESGAPVPQAV
jgi:ATP-binding cassette, subfamily B, bacterial